MILFFIIKLRPLYFCFVLFIFQGSVSLCGPGCAGAL